MTAPRNGYEAFLRGYTDRTPMGSDDRETISFTLDLPAPAGRRRVPSGTCDCGLACDPGFVSCPRCLAGMREEDDCVR